MTTPGGVPNLPAGALTLETLAAKLQDMTPAAMRGRAAERVPSIFDTSTAGNLLNDLSPGGIIAQLFAGFNSFVANADPADIKGPEDLPGLLVAFIESLPVVGELVGLLKAILGTYEGDDEVLLTIQAIFDPIRKLVQLVADVTDGFPSLEEIVDGFAKIPQLVGGLLNAALIPLLDASKIATGLFPISRIGDLQDTLDLLQSNIDAIPGAQGLIDNICNALGVSGTGHTVTDVYNALFAIPGGNIGSPISAINVPALDASKIVSGTLSELLIPLLTAAKVPTLDASKIGSGTLAEALIPLLTAAKIPNLEQSKINGLSATLATFLTGSSAIPQSQITGLVSDLAAKLTSASNLDATKLINTINAARIPTLDQSKVSGLAAALAALTSTTDFQTLLNNVFDGASGSTGSTGKTLAQVLSALQGQRSAVTSAASDASAAQTAAGDAQTVATDAQGTASDAQSVAMATLTSLFNKLGGNNASSATRAQADTVLQSLAGTVGQLSAAVAEMQGGGANGFSESISFRQPEVQVFDVAGTYTPVLPSWFNHATDSVDVNTLGGGAGGGGGGTPGVSGPGGDSVFKVAGVAKATGDGGGSVGSGSGMHPKGYSPGDHLYLDILYPGGGEAEATKPGSPPGGGGGGGNFLGVKGEGGYAGEWGSVTLGPGAATGALSLTVGAGGDGISGGFGAARGADGCVWVRARAGMPAAFTSMGTQLLPTFKLNTGVALTDAMTAAATWSRVPPGGAAGGHMLKIRSSADGTTYVYLLVTYVSGVTNYELGHVSSGVKQTPWKNGTIDAAIPFNSFWLSSDLGWIYTISILGVPFYSVEDTAHASSKGDSYRTGSWASSDSTMPGSIIGFAFFDSGTPSRITSSTVATSASTNLTTYTDLTSSTGPSVTLNVPPSGEIVVDLSAGFQSNSTNQQGYMGFVLSGANTLAAADSRAAALTANPTGGFQGVVGRRIHLTGLTPGTTTVKSVYRTSVGTATFTDRILIVEPKP